MLYQIFHVFDRDGGFGDGITQELLVATVDATEEQIKEFLKVWDKPRIYDRPFDALYEHHIVAKPVTVTKLEGFEPYDPMTRDWPDQPEDFNLHGCYWDGEKWTK